jgi:multisubunit Na+/H+ antiporter MnhE subunit
MALMQAFYLGVACFLLLTILTGLGRVFKGPQQVEQEFIRVFFLWVVSLLPGTAGVDLQGDTAIIHVLDKRLAENNKLQQLGKHCVELFVKERQDSFST